MKINFIYSFGRKKRISSKEEIPSDFFYGYKELEQYLNNIYIYEEEELGMKLKNNFFSKMFRKLSFFSIGIPLEMLYGFLISKNFKRFKNNEILVATTNGIGLTLSIAKNLGLIKSSIVFIAMGLIPKEINIFKKNIYKFILRNIDIVLISKSEENHFKQIMPNHKIHYIPFGIDNKFWYREYGDFNQEYVLGIGNDKSRDWDTLIDAWDSSFPKLKIITSKRINTDKENIQIIKGNWRDNLLTDREIRKLYGSSIFIVIPLKDTIQPSGQSVCLQAMSCQKSVIMSNIAGKWDSSMLINKKNIYLVKPHSKVLLNKAIKELIENKSLNETIAINSKKMVDNFYHKEIMANSLVKLFEEIDKKNSLNVN